MNVLILGSGGREHALAWKIIQSEDCEKLYVAPGNAGTESLAQNLNIEVGDFDKIALAIEQYNISMLIVGPEDPLVNGIRNYFEERTKFDELLIIGPDAKGAQLEGSKDFSKSFMADNDIPTASYKTFTINEIDDAYDYIRSQSLPIVIKADGLAAGKGVIIAQSKEEANETVKSMLVDKKFAQAGQKVLIEQFLDGIELSVFILSDGTNYLILPEAKDYKRIGEQDKGLNTGGMGAVSPVPFADNEFMFEVEETIVKPTLAGLARIDVKFVGFIFIGLMKVGSKPYVIEYNVRLGDPETQVVIPRIKSDLLELFKATAIGNLANVKLEISKDTATTVVSVAGGYPESYKKGYQISGLDKNLEATVFHAGTKYVDQKIITNGGRVLAATGMAHDITSALKKSYSTLDQINWQGMYYRKDIGLDLL